MSFKLSFVPDEQYYREAYDEIIASLRFKKYEPLFAIIMIGMGVGLFFQDKYKITGIFPIIFSCIGLYELIILYYQRKKWLKDRLDSKIVGQKIEFQFTDETIKHSGPFSCGEMKWTGIKKILKTKKGLLIKPENGISIYLQDKMFSDKEQIQFILSKEKYNSK
jgi:hypothetical protein